MRSCIIIANGDPPESSIIEYLQENGIDTIIAADGGANSLFNINIIPNFIIGDLDSIAAEVHKYFDNKSEIIKIVRQDDTDVEKSLKFAIERGYDTVYLFGGTGNRLDHSICNLGIILKFYNKIRIIMIHGETILYPYSVDVSLKTVPNETVSIYAFDDKTKITSKGLKYPLNNSTLQFGKKESTSNVAMDRRVELEINEGIIFVIRELKVMQDHGLIFHS